MNSELTKHNFLHARALQYGEITIERAHALTVLMLHRYMKNFNKHVSRSYVVNLNINYGGDTLVPQMLEPIVCPNPNCQKKIEELIIVSDKSATPEEQYYACPHCYIKLDWISTTLEREKREKKIEEKGPSRCSNHFGYLAMRVFLRGEDVPIPRECLACPKALDCVMKTSDS